MIYISIDSHLRSNFQLKLVRLASHYESPRGIQHTMAFATKTVDITAPDEGLSAAFAFAGTLPGLVREITAPHGRRYKLNTLSQLYHSFDANDVQSSAENIVNCTNLKGTDDWFMAVTTLKAAYQLAANTFEAYKKAESAAIPEDAEAPLPAGVADKLADDFQKKYNFSPVEWLIPADKTIAYFHRMFTGRGNKEVTPIKSIKSLMGTLEPDKNVTRRIGSLKIQFDEKEEKNEAVNGIYAYRNQLLRMAYAMAAAGSHEVDSKLVPGTKVIYAPLDINVGYAEEAYMKAMGKTNSQEWLKNKDEKTRRTMVRYMKEGYSQGEALTAALKKLELSWDKDYIEHDRPGQPSRPQHQASENEIAQRAAKIVQQQFRLTHEDDLCSSPPEVLPFFRYVEEICVPVLIILNDSECTRARSDGSILH